MIAARLEADTDADEPDTQQLLTCLQESPPLSVTMAEQIAELRGWAQGRCMPAHAAADD